MINEVNADEIEVVRKQLGMLPRKKKKPEGPYEVDTTKEADMTEQAAAPAPETRLKSATATTIMNGCTVKTRMETTPCTIGQ